VDYCLRQIFWLRIFFLDPPAEEKGKEKGGQNCFGMVEIIIQFPDNTLIFCRLGESDLGMFEMHSIVI